MLGRFREFLPQANSVLLGILLAVLAVLVLAWVTFGLVRSGDDQGGPVADQEMVAQAQDSGADSPAPEAENRNVDSYAAYEAKDPFRQIVEPAEANTGEDIGSSGTGDDTSDGDTSGGGTSSGGSSDDSGDGSNGESDTSDTTDNGPASSSSGGTGSALDNGTSGGSASTADGSQRGQALDSDGDKVSNKREKQLGLNPTNLDTDGDGIQDGADDSNGDGRPDRDIGRRGGESGGGNGGSGGNGDLFDSGGSLLPSGK